MGTVYDCAVIGGGIAGLQAAIQLGRYNRHVLVIDAGDGRSVQCRGYNNLLGWPDGVSGHELRMRGRQQAEKTGVQFMQGKVIEAVQSEGQFQLELEGGQSAYTKRLLLATGIVDRMPDLPGLLPCLGRSIYVCPDCDGYEIMNQKAVVLGSGRVGAQMALTLSYWTKEIVFINHERAVIDEKLNGQLQAAGIEQRSEPVAKLVESDGNLSEVILQSGENIHVRKGFIAFGGNEVRSELAARLGVKLHNNKYVIVDPRTKMTNVTHVWCAGDVVAHSEQVAIAMGDGVQAAIWIHKSLLGIPVPRVDE